MSEGTERIPASEFNPETERDVQGDLFRWADAASSAWPELDLLFAVPNGQMRQGIAMEPGLKAGVPDMLLPAARIVPLEDGEMLSHGLFIELKRKDGRVRPEQEEWHEALQEQGYTVVVAYGFDEAVDTLKRYLSWNMPGSTDS